MKTPRCQEKLAREDSCFSIPPLSNLFQLVNPSLFWEGADSSQMKFKLQRAFLVPSAALQLQSINQGLAGCCRV